MILTEEKTIYNSMFSITSSDLQLFSTQEEVLVHIVSASQILWINIEDMKMLITFMLIPPY